jgi:hypothetical protein
MGYTRTHIHYSVAQQSNTMSKDELDAEAQAAAAAYPVLTEEIVKEILQSEPPYTNDDEKETCRRMVEELTPEELTTAACTSYAFWFALHFYAADAKPSDDDALQMAMREARRHLVGSNHDESAALERLRKTCHFRKVSSRWSLSLPVLHRPHLLAGIPKELCVALRCVAVHSLGTTYRFVS